MERCSQASVRNIDRCFPLDLFALERLGFAPLCNNVRHNSTSQLKTAWYSAVLPAMLPNSEPVTRAFILAPNSSNKAHLSLFSVISATSHRSGIPAGLVIRVSLQFGSAPNSKHFRAVLRSSEINTRWSNVWLSDLSRSSVIHFSKKRQDSDSRTQLNESLTALLSRWAPYRMSNRTISSALRMALANNPSLALALWSRSNCAAQGQSTNNSAEFRS